MAAVTLYRFRVDLSDLDRGVYDTLDFRIAMHPSETTDYLLTRVLAYCLNENVEFAGEGLSDPDVAALTRKGLHGAIDLWIEIGNPSARKLHRATKAATTVRVYTYKDTRMLLKEMAEVPRAVEAFSFSAGFLDEVSEHLERDNRWNLLVQDGALTLSGDSFSLEGSVRTLGS